MSRTFTCIIIDDEEYAVGILSESLKSLYDNIEIAGSYTSWKEGLAALRTIKADILFLDVSLGGKTGMDILKLVPELDCEIIFITAYSEFAVDAFKFSATGYVVKPIKDEDLAFAVNKAIKRINDKQFSKTDSKPVQAFATKIGIPSGSGIDYINVNEIIYFESVSGYTKVITQHAEILSSFNLGKFKISTKGQPFYQLHRSYIVNLNHIKRYNTIGEVVMTNDKVIPVSRNLRDEFMQLFSMINRGGY